MILTLAELARWHARQAKLTAGTDRDFHLAAAKLLRGLVQAKAEHRERIMEGLERARAKGTPPGRPRVDEKIEATIKRLLKKGTGTKAIARETGASPSVIIRIKRELGLKVQPWTRRAEAKAE
jgi:hypothetical protein